MLKSTLGKKAELYLDATCNLTPSFEGAMFILFRTETLSPECFVSGTCINNTSVMMFKKGSFEIGGTIHPVAIKVLNNWCFSYVKGL